MDNRDEVRLPTKQGDAVATRADRDDSGISRWSIAYPWGTEPFFGNSAGLVAHMRARIVAKGLSL